MPTKIISAIESAPARTGFVADAEHQLAAARQRIVAVRADSERLTAARVDLGPEPDSMADGVAAYRAALDAWQQRASGLQQQWIAAQSQERESQRALSLAEAQLADARQRRDLVATVAAEWTATLEAWSPLLALVSGFDTSGAVQAARTARTRSLSDATMHAYSALLGYLTAIVEAHTAALVELARYDGDAT